MSQILFLKAHVKGHLRDGKWVKDYDTKTHAASFNAKYANPGQKVLGPQYGGQKTLFHVEPKFYPNAKPHPNAPKTKVNEPSDPSHHITWINPLTVATFVPGGKCPPEMNGIPFAPWDAPKTEEEWANVEGQLDMEEPDLMVALGKHAASGVVIQEDDGRVWLTCPTNGFGGYLSTFPKGTVEDGAEMSLQQNAIREVFEETGLKVEITGLLGDFQRTTSTTRLYTGRRVAGTPSGAGWEAQAVKLVPMHKLHAELKGVDHAVAAALGVPDEVDK
jgi:8-oxo-dGTP pyrophosphatase MutT (NUDIX family)